MQADIQKALNEQLNMELKAYYTYLSMSAFMEELGLKGFATWMFHHAQEEMEHAMRIYNYIQSRRGHIKLLAIPEPDEKWESVLAAFEAALGHEEAVTTAIHALVKLARQEHDYATESFLQWFVDEQVEEEEVVDDAIQKLKLVNDFKPGLYLLDKEMATGHLDKPASVE
ncbi:ferritin [Anaerolineales bacterium]